MSILIAKLSDLFDSSKTLFLKLTVSEIEFPTVTLTSVAPSFLARSKQKEAFDFKYSSSLIMIYNFVPPTVILSIRIDGWATPTGTP